MYLKYGPKCCTSGDLKTVTVMLERRFKNVKKMSGGILKKSSSSNLLRKFSRVPRGVTLGEK